MSNAGTASKPAISIEDAVAKVDIWRGKTVEFERIAGGITNINWRVTLPQSGETYFLKIHGPGTGTFIDRDVAHEAALKVPATGYAPALLFYDSEDGIEVHEFLHGFRSCGVLDVQNPTIRQNILTAYKAVHSTQRLSATKTGFDQLDHHLGRLREMKVKLPYDLDHLLWQRSRAERAISASGFDLCACYNDGYVSNYMVDDRLEVKIIDWEYAANNDPYWDLAMFSLENFFLQPEDRRKTLEMYDGSFREDLAARIHLYVGVASIVWGLWATYQEMTSSIPFDFGKYADLLFLRGRHTMAIPEWEHALAAV